MIKLVQFLKYSFSDKYNEYIRKKDLKMNEFGIRVFVGQFGAGKTSSMVEYVYRLACKYPGINILTVLSLNEDKFPAGTNIEKLTSYKQIIDAPENTVILLDEFSSLFPASEWRKGIPQSLKAVILQVRKKNMLLLGTAQEFADLYVFFRRHTATVHECTCLNGRWNFVRTYDAFEYEIRKNPRHIKKYSFIQTDFIRSLYNTKEIITPIDMTDVWEEDARSDEIEIMKENQQLYSGRRTRKKKR